MMYELALAQLLASLLGNTVLRYATTIGVYVAAMGFGAIFFKPDKRESDLRLFYRAEVALTVLGLIAPIAFILVYYFLAISVPSSAQSILVLLFTHAIIVMIGFLSGFELPILSSLLERDPDYGSSHVLAFDYMGMFLASLLFPLYLFPKFGVFPSFWCVTLLNLFAAFLTPAVESGKVQPRAMLPAYILLLLIVNSVFLFWSAPLTHFLSEVYAKSF